MGQGLEQIAAPLAGGVLDWLQAHARTTQIFFVASGFVLARSLGWPAPYPVTSLPVLLGVAGGNQRYVLALIARRHHPAGMG